MGLGMSGGWTTELLSGAVLEVEIEILGRLLEARRLSGREAPHGRTAAFAMLHRKMGDLRDEVVHSRSLKPFFGVAPSRCAGYRVIL